jgi:hypothetical protein
VRERIGVSHKLSTSSSSILTAHDDPEGPALDGEGFVSGFQCGGVEVDLPKFRTEYSAKWMSWAKPHIDAVEVH